MAQSWQKLQPLEHVMLERYVPDKQDVITITLTIAKTITLEHLQDCILHRLLSHPRFSSIPTLNHRGTYHFKQVPGFTSKSDALLDHICFESPIPASESEEEQRLTFISRLSQISSTSLDLSKPLWKIHVFGNWALVPSERSTSTTIVVRVHHSIADGIGLVKYFLAKLVDKSNEASLLVPTKRIHRAIGGPWYRTVRESLNDVYKMLVKPLFRDPVSVFTRAPVGKANLLAMLAPRAFTVTDVKAASSRLCVTINDLLLGAFAGAVRSYAIEFGDDPHDLNGMRVAMPFNHHTFDDFEMSDVSNQLVMIPVGLPVNIADRAERLAKSVDLMSRLKRGVQSGVATQAMRVLARLPHALRRVVWARVAKSASMIFSNVAGPRECVMIGGGRVSAAYFSPPCDVHNAVNIGIFSYDDGFFVSVAGDAARLKEPQKLVDYFSQEVTSMIEMSVEPEKPFLPTAMRRSLSKEQLQRRKKRT